MLKLFSPLAQLQVPGPLGSAHPFQTPAVINIGSDGKRYVFVAAS